LQSLFGTSIRPPSHDTTGFQTGWTTGCIVQTNIQSVLKTVEQQVVCLHDVNALMLGCVNQTRLNNRLDNRLYRINGVLIISLSSSQSLHSSTSVCIVQYTPSALMTCDTLTTAAPSVVIVRHKMRCSLAKTSLGRASRPALAVYACQLHRCAWDWKSVG